MKFSRGGCKESYHGRGGGGGINGWKERILPLNNVAEDPESESVLTACRNTANRLYYQPLFGK